MARFDVVVMAVMAVVAVILLIAVLHALFRPVQIDLTRYEESEDYKPEQERDSRGA